MSKEDALPPWDLQQVKRQVRARRRMFEDRRSPLVREAHELEKVCEVDTKTRAALVSSIATVVGAGGDASNLRAQVSQIDERLLPARERLAAVNKEWGKLNEVCKWIEMADEGLHWLIFAQSDLDKHDQVGVWAPDYHLRKREATKAS